MTQGNILLADDNKLVVKITSAILEDADYDVSVAWDGLEAINKAYAEEPDLVILDVEMPKINGYQVCRLLKDDEYTRDIPVVMLTGRDQQSDMFWGLKTGADAYVTKGFKPEQLLGRRQGADRAEPDGAGTARPGGRCPRSCWRRPASSAGSSTCSTPSCSSRPS